MSAQLEDKMRAKSNLRFKEASELADTVRESGSLKNKKDLEQLLNIIFGLLAGISQPIIALRIHEDSELATMCEALEIVFKTVDEIIGKVKTKLGEAEPVNS